MDWKNTEQYDDHTAAQAMLRVMAPPSREAEALDDEGCLLLVEALVRQAAEDYLLLMRRPGRYRHAERMQEIERFFLSNRFRRLTGMDGKAILRRIRREVSAL